MKKLLILCGLVGSMFVSAQGLGDYMEINGVPGFVFYVDETGEHGLVMSFRALSQKQLEKSLKKSSKRYKKMEISADVQETAQQALGKLSLPIPSKKISSKEKEKAYKGLVSLLSDDGEQNALVIADYCKDNDLSMLDYFPDQYWASQLGDGWFIPGDKELTLFAEFYAGGLGKEHSLGNTSITNRPKELSNDPIVQSQIIWIVFNGLRSSSMRNSDIGFRALIPMVSGAASIKIKRWLELLDTINKKPITNVNTCAIHKF